jgi:hypothetical protein
MHMAANSPEGVFYVRVTDPFVVMKLIGGEDAGLSDASLLAVHPSRVIQILEGSIRNEVIFASSGTSISGSQ